MEIFGLIIGLLFGAALFLSGLADPDKIIGALRLKDLHAIRVTLLAVLAVIIGTWIVSMFHSTHPGLPPNDVVAVLVGGAILGAGIGIGGYCPATGIACAGAGRIDAIVAVMGMLAGGLLYIVMYSSVAAPLERIAHHNPSTLQNATDIPNIAWIVVIAIAGGLTLKALANARV
ncbi:YeeE/YedE family protein [bacterium]|nr:YeeE/YedE family protein [bacterium]